MQATVKSPNWPTNSAAAHVVSLNGLAPFKTAAGVLPDGSTNPKTNLGESMKRLAFLVTVLICLLAALPVAYTQTTSGQITGRLVDSGGAVIPGGKIQLANDLTKQVREFTTDSSGNFTFTNVPPGNYSIRIAQPGFKTYEQKGITVGAVERVALPEIALQVGELSTSVEVQASAVHVATDSSDRGVSVNTTQIEDTVTKGRNFLALMATLPGVQDTNQTDSRGWGTGSPTLMGGQSGQKLLVLDGAASQDSGNRDFGYIAPSVDAIAEVRVLVANYNAEYGARSGGQMNVVIKGGTNQFHGSGYFFLRNEKLNANEFFNNKTGVPRPSYRYQNLGGTIGGPFIIPGTRFNKSHNKLFWFFSYDYLHNKNQTGANRYTMPTALERAGDFSATTTTTGALVPIKDPLSGAQFPGNKIPASRLDRTGLAMMNLFPLPNTTDPTGQRQYNAEFINPYTQPRHDRILRVDYPISSRATSYVRLLQDYTGNDGYGQILGALGDGWRQFPHGYDIPSAGAVAAFIYTFRPNLISETMWGITRGHQMNTPTDMDLYQNSLLPLKDATGIVPLTRLSASNTLNLRPQVNFGLPNAFNAQSAGQGITNAPQYGFDSRWPFDGTDQVQTVNTTVSWVKASHNLKFGFYLEKMARNVSVYSTYNIAGSYYFGSDTASPVDTGYPYSNLATGGLFAYGEDSLKQVNHARYTQIDWFVQDSWKVTPRFSVDLGMRFQYQGPLHTAGQRLGLFDTSVYDRNKSGQPLYPALVNGVKRAVNPVTGASYPYVLQGTYDPASFTGSPFSGVKDYIGNFWNAPPISLGPRVGFAWDVFGNGRTAIRGGFGIFYDRAATVDYIGALGVGTGPLAAPPQFLAPILLNTTFTAMQGAQSLFAPQNIQGGSPDHLLPTTYNWSFGIQRELPWGLIFDVAYVANVYKHGFNSNATIFDGNAVPPFTTWTPAGGTNKTYVDPTSSSGALYSTNLIRSLTGFKGVGQIPTFVNNGTSSYNSLQVQLNRRIGRKITFSANYTWSKTMLYNRQQFTDDALTRAETGNRPHAFNANFGYAIPALPGANKFVKQVTDGWRFTGTAQIFSGSGMAPNCGFTNNPVGYPNGTPTGGVLFRCQMPDATQNGLWLPSGSTPSTVGSTSDPKLWYPINVNNFVLPKDFAPFSRGIIGNMPPILTYGPGMELFNLSLLKEFRIREGQKLEFKIESTNALNHFNPANPNMTITRNYVTGANTNAAFGSIQGTQFQSRRAVVSVRYAF
jgi:Carboxypeptidase regulatory-like domain/TonB-dependent Receptor Plug Domain